MTDTDTVDSGTPEIATVPFDFTGAGLLPVPDQVNIDKAIELFTERNDALKTYSNAEDSESGKAVADAFRADAGLSKAVDIFMATQRKALQEFMDAHPGASVILRDAKLYAELKTETVTTANDDIAAKRAESETPDANREAQIAQLKSDATMLKAFVGQLESLAAAFGNDVKVPELPKISGPRARKSGKNGAVRSDLPRFSVNGEFLAEGTSTYNAVKAARTIDAGLPKSEDPGKDYYTVTQFAAAQKAESYKWGHGNFAAELPKGTVLVVHSIETKSAE